MLPAGRATQLSLAGEGASGVCRQALGLIIINVLSNSRAAVQRESVRRYPMLRPHGVQAVLVVTLFAASANGCATDVALSSAVNRGDLADVQTLLAAGHDPDAAFSEGWTPLTVASSAGDVRLVTLLLDAGADVNRTKDSWLNQDGRTPLHWAAAGGHLAVVVLLLERGARVHVTDAEGRTPLHAAARGGNPDVVAQLLRHGASADTRDNQGLTPLMVAAGSAEKDGASKVAQALLQASNNVTAVDPRGRSALHWAASTGSADFVGTLITFGGEVDRRTVDGDTALWWAAAKGNDAVVSRLLEAGADRSLARADGTTPRAVALQNGHVRAATLLAASPAPR